MIERSDLGVNLFKNIFHTRLMRITNLKYKVVKGFALCLESKENVSSNHAVSLWLHGNWHIYLKHQCSDGITQN